MALRGHSSILTRSAGWLAAVTSCSPPVARIASVQFLSGIRPGGPHSFTYATWFDEWRFLFTGPVDFASGRGCEESMPIVVDSLGDTLTRSAVGTYITNSGA